MHAAKDTDDTKAAPRVAPDPGADRKRIVAIVLAAAGVVVSLYLEVLHVQTYLGLGHSAICEAGAHLSCSDVALSSASVLLGVPLPVWGVAGFLAMGNAAVRRSRLLLPLAGFGSLASIALLVYELVSVGAICMFCEVVHFLCFGLLAVAWMSRKQTTAQLGPKALLYELGPPGLVVVGVFLLAPPYWNAATWQSGVRLPHGETENGRPWLGSENPDLVIHEYIDYGCPHCKVATARMKMRLGSDKRLRVVRHHQPRMHCGEDPEAASRCFHVRAALCAQEQGKFWEMDDWLFHVAPGTPKVDLEPAAQEVQLDLDTLRSCMASRETFVRAQAEVDDAHKWGIRGTPGYVVDGARVEPADLQELLRAR